MVEGDLLFGLVLQKKALDAALRRLGPPQGDAEIGFLDLVVPDLFVEDAQGLGVLGGDDDAAGVPVDAVAEGGGEGILQAGVPLLLLIEIGLDVGEQGVHPLVLVGVDHQTGALVQQHDLVVFI